MSILDYCRLRTKQRLLAGESVPWVEYQTKRNRRDYVKRCVLSFPLWVRRKDFSALEQEKVKKEASTGVKHSFDHIIPITHPYVSGLSVPWNIQVIPLSMNSGKGARFNPYQVDLLEGYSNASSL